MEVDLAGNWVADFGDNTFSGKHVAVTLPSVGCPFT